jgi:hypothetical protein
MKRSFKLKIIDKNIEKGFFFNSYIITVKDPAGILNFGMPFPLEASRQQYYSLMVGDIQGIFFEQDSNNKWNVCNK